MPKLGPKRQITLPASLCREVGIKPGDKVETHAFSGYIMVVPPKKPDEPQGHPKDTK